MCDRRSPYEQRRECQHYRMAELNLLAAIVIAGMPPISAKRSDNGNSPA